MQNAFKHTIPTVIAYLLFLHCHAADLYSYKNTFSVSYSIQDEKSVNNNLAERFESICFIRKAVQISNLKQITITCQCKMN